MFDIICSSAKQYILKMRFFKLLNPKLTVLSVFNLHGELSFLIFIGCFYSRRIKEELLLQSYKVIGNENNFKKLRVIYYFSFLEFTKLHFLLSYHFSTLCQIAEVIEI